MSFSSEQKKEIVISEMKNQCCKTALLQGMLSARAALSSGIISLPSSSEEILEFTRGVLTDVYFKEASIVIPENGGRRKLLTFRSPALEKFLTSLCDGISVNEKCPGCTPAFLRGVFLASGRITDPKKQYLLEFSLGERAELFAPFFAELGMTPRISVKKNETVIYFKSSAEIEDFFAMANMNQTAFAVMNEKIESEIRNSVNRVANCVTNNIEKAVSASMNQIALIRRLSERGLLSLLPDELELTARARMEHSELSLSQLAAIITPPISKPGLSHRLQKITAIATELLEKGEK